MVATTPFVIGVAGGSASGKTTIAERLTELAPSGHVSLIRIDSYYVPAGDDTYDDLVARNWDHPDAFDWPLLLDHVDQLRQGGTIEVPVYDFASYDRTDAVVVTPPTPIVVIEGILVLWEPHLRELFDLKVFVDTEADLRFIRRLQRDVSERGRTLDSVIDQYLTTVRPSHEQFIEPSKRHADVIIPQGGMNRPAVDVLLARVNELAAR